MAEHDHTEPPSDIALRVKALESLLLDKGLVEAETLDAIVELYEHNIGPKNGAHVVAHAWTDPEFKARLLADATPAIAELNYGGVQGEDMVVVENTPDKLFILGLGKALGLLAPFHLPFPPVNSQQLAVNFVGPQFGSAAIYNI